MTKEMSNALIDSVLSGMSLGSFRLFGFDDDRNKKVEIIEPEVEPSTPPEPITMAKLKDLNAQSGMIYTCFPDGQNNPEYAHLPTPYFTLSPKEKLLLVFAENFRRQYKQLYPKRRPLVLAVENECKVQKFVCTSIRPTTFIEFPELIDNWKACASFVADHIAYEPLENSTNIVSDLIFFSIFVIFIQSHSNLLGSFLFL
jgi:hypothetical protein